MKIVKITAKNFRTFKDFSVDTQSNYITISGKNNAGKTALVKIIQNFLRNYDEERFYPNPPQSLSYAKDKTQWLQDSEAMSVGITIELDRTNDSEVVYAVTTFSKTDSKQATILVELEEIFRSDEDSELICRVNGEKQDKKAAIEIRKKIRTSNNFVVHNSTDPARRYYYVGDSYTEILEAHLHHDERQKIADAEKTLQNRVKKAAKQHKEDLSKLLGKLSDKFQVEFATLERSTSTRFPLAVKLTDKSVEVPLGDWGAGTQNRTRVLMSVMEAARIREAVKEEDRISPVFIVEEPESFLHPAAQAEFGQVLNELANELQIQIIATTHSPYILNQSDPSSNILLERKLVRNLPKETYLIPSSGSDWMKPFSECLGIIPNEFEDWRSVFSAESNKVVLVEGAIDVAYFKHFKENYPEIYQIPDDVEVIPYDGKDALKNTSILSFLVKKFQKVYITFDLDAESELKPSLEKIGLKAEDDFHAIGARGKSSGSDCIEGLLPAEIKKAVFAEQYELVTEITSSDSKARNKARQTLKKKLLEKFQEDKIDTKKLSEFKKLFTTISKAFK